MNTYVVGFNKHNGKMGKRTIKARDKEEAMDKLDADALTPASGEK